MNIFGQNFWFVDNWHMLDYAVCIALCCLVSLQEPKSDTRALEEKCSLFSDRYT